MVLSGGGRDGDEEDDEEEKENASEDDSDAEQASHLDNMQHSMNESVSKNRGQKHLFSAFFEFLKLQAHAPLSCTPLRCRHTHP